MDLSANQEQMEELPWPRCFNCFHDIVKPKAEPLETEELPSCTVDSEGNIISISPFQCQQDNSNKPSCLDRLIYVFELLPSEIEALTRTLSDSDVKLCDPCDVHLASMYTGRQLFLQATSQASCLTQILSSNRATEPAADKPGVKRKRSENCSRLTSRTRTSPKSRKVEVQDSDSSWEPDDDHHFQVQFEPSGLRNPPEDDPEWILPTISQREETNLISSMTPFTPLTKQAVVILERIDATARRKPGPRSRRIKLKTETQYKSFEGSNEGNAETSRVTKNKKQNSASAKKSAIKSKVKPVKKPRLSETKSSQCPKCGKVFSTSQSVNKHLRKNACESNKSRLAAPNQPDTRSTISYTFTCPICGNPSLATGGGRLEQHLRTHMNADERAQELICCGIHHKTLKDLGLHRKSDQCTAAKIVVPLNRPNVKKMSMCPVCGKVIYSVVPSALKHHMDVMHASKSNYVCRVCARPCHNLRSLREHELTHCSREEREALKSSRVRNHLCQLCGKAFYKKEHLKQHANKVHNIPQPGIRNFMEVVIAQSDLVECSKTEQIEIVPFASPEAQSVGEVEVEAGAREHASLIG